MKANKIATYGLLVALAFILSYIESLLPTPFPMFPGIKLGLANLVVIAALYTQGAKEALVLSFIRILLSGLIFQGVSMMLFSLAGGAFSWLVMALLKKSKAFSMVGVSIAGGIAHNIGQIFVAILVVENTVIIGYLPYLLISGVAAGAIIGILGFMIVKRLKNIK